MMIASSLSWAMSNCGGDFNSAYNYYGGQYNMPTAPNRFAFAALKQDGSIFVWGDSRYGGVDEPSGSDYTSIVSTQSAFAALTETGSIKVWGNSATGGDSTMAPVGSGYTSIVSTQSAFAALKSDGSIRVWGAIDHGGGGIDSPTGNEYKIIYSNSAAFAALKKYGSIYAWGANILGGVGAPTDDGYNTIFSNEEAFVALKDDGSLSTWGNIAQVDYIAAPTDSGYTKITSTNTAFAALKSDGSIKAWGNKNNGGSNAPTDNGYVEIFSTERAFAALKNDGSISVWGDSTYGGANGPPGEGYTTITSNFRAFAVLDENGKIYAWGGGAAGGNNEPLDSGYVSIFSSRAAFAALKSDGTISTWGLDSSGGTNNIPPTGSGHTTIFSTQTAFAAQKADGSIDVWGEASRGGNSTDAPIDSGYVFVNNTNAQSFGPENCQQILSFALEEVAEDIAGNMNGKAVTAEQLNSIEGVTGAVANNESVYTPAFQSGHYANSNEPTAAEVQAIVSSVNSKKALAEVAEDINGNANGRMVTAEELNRITGVSDAVSANESFYTVAFQNSSYADAQHPTAAEVQAVIAAVNAEQGALAEVVEDIDGNANNIAVTAAQLNSISHVSGALEKNERHYTTALENAIFVNKNKPSSVEIQAVVDAVNAERAALKEVTEDISGNDNGIAVTATQLNNINGVSSAVSDNKSAYTQAFQSGTYADRTDPTAAELQTVITKTNSAQALIEVAEDISGNANGSLITVVELNRIIGINNAITVNESAYAKALREESYATPGHPTAAEVAAVIDTENSDQEILAQVAEDISGNTDNMAVTAAQLNSINHVSGALAAHENLYTAAFAMGTYVDDIRPTAEEVQTVISAVNAEQAALSEVAEDIAGNDNGVAVTAAQLNSINGVSGALEANKNAYTKAFQAGTYADSSKPTAAELQSRISAVNAEQAALSEVAEDIAGNDNGVAVTAAQLNSINGVSGALEANKSAYTKAFQAGTYADSSKPTAAELQSQISAVNAEQAALSEVAEDIAGNDNGVAVTVAQLNSINGVSGALEANKSAYTKAFQAGTYADSSKPTAAELQSRISAVNAEQAALREAAEDIAGNDNGVAVTAAQLNSINGVNGALEANKSVYTKAFQAGTYADSSKPTAAELQSRILAVNAEQAALSEVAEDIAGNDNGVSITAAQLNSINGVSGALEANKSAYTKAFQSGTYADSSKPTAAELQSQISAVNSEQAVLTEVAEDIAGNDNGVAVTAAQLNSIDGVSGALEANKSAYTKAFQAGTYADSSKPTAAELQSQISAVNAEQAALSEVAEDIAGNDNDVAVTAAQLNSISGVSGALEANKSAYTKAFQSGTYADSSKPTAAELQSRISAVNAEQAALSEVAEDIAGNDNGVAVTATQLNSINGVSGALDANKNAYTKAFQAGTYADSSKPTTAELQSRISAVNAEQAALSEVAEDIAGNDNGVAVTATQLNSINGVSGALEANKNAYTKAFQAGTYADSSKPTAAELQSQISAVNAEQAALSEVAEDIAGNDNGVAATAAQLNSINGISGALEENKSAYTTAFQSGTYTDPSKPTVAELQAVVFAVNAEQKVLSEVAEDIAGNDNGIAATAAQLNSINGISGALDANKSAYTTAFQSGTYTDPSKPTAAELQAVISSVNTAQIALREITEYILGNHNGAAITTEKLNLITGVDGALTENEAAYLSALQAGNYTDPSNPTAAELQTIVSAVNAEQAALTEVTEDIVGNGNGVTITATQLNSINGVSGAIDANRHAYATAFQSALYANARKPTAAELQAVILAVNAELEILAEVAEDISGNHNGKTVTTVQLNYITGIDSALVDNESSYLRALQAGNYIDPSNPTAEELQSIISAVNTEQSALSEVTEDIDGNANGVSVTAAQINQIRGVDGAVVGNEKAYILALIEGHQFGAEVPSLSGAHTATSPAGAQSNTNTPTPAQLQAVVDGVNAERAIISEIIEDSSGNINGISVTAAQLNSLRLVSGAIAENINAYIAAFQEGDYTDPANLSVAEIQDIIARVNSQASKVKKWKIGTKGTGALSYEFLAGLIILLIISGYRHYKRSSIKSV